MANMKATALLFTLLALSTLGPNPAAARDLLDTTGASSGSGVSAASSGSASSCSGAQASAGLGGFATAYSQNSAQVIAAAAAACASAAAEAYSNICKGGNTYALAATFAEVCANSVAEVYVSSFSSSKVMGYGNACAKGCANGQAVASSVAQAVSNALANAGACQQVQVQANSEAFALAFTSATGEAWSIACSKGPGNAASSASALAFIGTCASAYAAAFAQVVAKTCGGGCDTCSCSIGPNYPLSALTSSMATVSGGLSAVAEAWGKAGAAVCSSNGTPIETLASGVAEVWGLVAVDAIIRINVNTYTKGHACACAGIFAEADVQAVAESSSNLLAATYVQNFKKRNCAGAYVALDASAFNQNFVSVYKRAYAELCSSGQSSTTDIDIVRIISTDGTISNAIAGALSGIDSCICADTPFCPSRCPKK